MKNRHIVECTAAVTLLLMGSAHAEDHKLVIKDFMFTPMAITIPVGDTVIWDNEDGEPHTVVSLDGGYRSKALDEKDSFSHTFTSAGTFKYVCSIHPRMTGTVTVTAK